MLRQKFNENEIARVLEQTTYIFGNLQKSSLLSVIGLPESNGQNRKVKL